MSEFTKGPWHYIGEEYDDFVVYAGEEYICNVGESYISPLKVLIGTLAFDIKDQANARLIAAAPDLLSALQATINRLEELADDFAMCSSPVALRKAKEALAKANGESE